MASSSLFAAWSLVALVVVATCPTRASALAAVNQAAGGPNVPKLVRRAGAPKPANAKVDQAGQQKTFNLQTVSFGADGAPSSTQTAAHQEASPTKANFETVTAGFTHTSQKTVDLIRRTLDDFRTTDRPQFTLLFVIICLVLCVCVACIRPWSAKNSTLQCPPSPDKFCLQMQKFGPAQKSMGSAAMYNHCFEECSHEDGVRTYQARGQTFRFCDQCGSRWMMIKSTKAFVPVTPKALPADA